ncbi:hypothetical protein ASE25_09260 [Terrabacter sp. Root85]|nr:hypothetical protein ASE25_09260 [Terrabacter sp. Root85]
MIHATSASVAKTQLQASVDFHTTEDDRTPDASVKSCSRSAAPTEQVVQVRCVDCQHSRIVKYVHGLPLTALYDTGSAETPSSLQHLASR